MQLYQNRGFNEFFQDTFTFLKLNGKHYFKHYFIINGALLLILAVLTYYMSKFYTDTVYGNLLGGVGVNNSNPFEDYMNENFGMFFLIMLGIIIMFMILGIVSYAYTPIYFKLYEKNNNTSFSTKDIIDMYKKHSGKLVLFIVFGILLAIPVGIAFGIGMMLLAITIIGILAIPLLVGFLAGLYNMTLLEYLDGKRNFWDSFGYAWTLITSKFWHAVGCMGIFYLITYIVQLGLSVFQSAFSTASILTGIESNNLSVEEQSLGMTVFLLFIFFITFLVSMTMSIINQTNQSIVYYGLKEEKENVNTTSVIDQIGNSEF
ncbi:hypothetical protein [uncultured Lacinutrix sp.]|uniref:hypothetical protein n=1 Tax=uncultured Lacinutrix sp. TaxID=574032 RepID=UPI002624006E|nr:hypothetical protein [uncultured Lacinutrix sp.]